ncbi:MAG: ImmA/IrrE family metallo-endopeptidase [Verrucomicrobiia bacterium]
MSWRPRRMESFARWYGLYVHSEDLPPSVRGFFAEFSRDIAINKNDHPMEQQFTIAHELTHYRVHYGRLKLSTHKEREHEADFFAYGLLYIARRFDALRYHFARHPMHVFPAFFAIPFFVALFPIVRIIYRLRVKRRRKTIPSPAQP